MPAGRVAGPQAAGSVQPAMGSLAVDTDNAVEREQEKGDGRSDLERLKTIATIGSTVDPSNGDQNPYGLAIAPAERGLFQKGDLVVCNFNNAANVQGTGTTIVALHPKQGSTPLRVAQDRSLLGCTEVALGPTDNVWASAFAANDNPIVSPNGAVLTTLAGGPWSGPFGQVFAPAGEHRAPAFYESNATNGTIVRINIKPGMPFTYDIIAKGFAVNGGAPGSILGPSGLQYDAQSDKLYIVDGDNNTVVTFRHVSTIPNGGIVVSGHTFSGPFAGRAKLLFSGEPLNGPISSALLNDGHLVLGNTLDPNGKNIMVEIDSHGRLLGTKNVDTGASGAIFGMVAAPGHERSLYFNDDNENAVKVLKE
ncbi:MAG: hypothetical protein M3126_00850 [Candidatus Eremiobacteraeota bacterium]|nr:hypothetical protein [Candidatus Eremiobacteraeota bacterium]